MTMRKYWYPIMLSKEVVSGKVFQMHILDDPLVIFRDPETGLACAFADKCPHRSAPLSVGRIMDGKLECRYHGWQFDHEGNVTHIPSLLEGKKIPPNAKVYKYPTHEDEHYLWVWPGPKDDAEKVPKPRMFFQKEDNTVAPRFGYFDFDIDHCLLVENFLDPAHLPFTHDSTISKRSNAAAMNVTLEFTTKGTVAGVQDTPDRADIVPVKFEFIPPNLVSLEFRGGEQGHSRFFWVQRFNFFKFTDWFPPFKWYMDYVFTKFNYKITMEDYAMLIGQQRNLNFGANAMNSPVSADILIKTYRNWWRKAMKKKPYFAGYSEDIEDIVLNGCAASARCSSVSDMETAKKKRVISKQNGIGALHESEDEELD
ncbi:hypothetical protein HDU96_005758 [Phlyctochytrium bullatum]|nr:hypothetical protein HDU96_005758 [Phlyctochytrium bullatum]